MSACVFVSPVARPVSHVLVPSCLLLHQLLLLAGVCGRSALMECSPEMPTPSRTHVCVSVCVFVVPVCVCVCEL